MKLLKICEPIRFSNALQVFENLLTLGKVMKVKVKNCKAHFTSKYTRIEQYCNQCF